MTASHSTENVRGICFLLLRWKNLVVCCDVNGLLKCLNLNHEPTEGRLFIDSSKLFERCIAVLLLKGNRLLSIYVGNAVQKKETHVNMTTPLDSIKYGKNKLKNCGDLKVIFALLGMQLGYDKTAVFLYM